ncbi:MAG: GlsB/YeaQ/YmgE family stress response membrane protein [Dehalobacter sp.]|nr:GlsB/YeaQ/YmgE family stress response membrane protein [Dehalobacter sp.]
MSVIGWIILGGLAGWIASMITGRDAKMGVGMNIVVGIVGAFIGGWIVNIFGGIGINGFNVWSFLVALLGAVILLSIVNALTGRKHSHNQYQS